MDNYWTHGHDFPQAAALVSDSLPGRFPADDTLFELIANFQTESLTFFNKSSPGDVGLICGRSAVATTITSPSCVACLTCMNERVGRKLNRHTTLQCWVTAVKEWVTEWLCEQTRVSGQGARSEWVNWSFLHARPWIPGDEIFTAVIH